ncbi:MAG: magnesium transporter [Candidatus Helarchaeota archaeon]
MKVRRIILEAAPTLLFASSISVIAGFLLNSTLSVGEVFGVLIITPAILGVAGDIGTSYGARVSTLLHSGLVEPRFRRFRLVIVDFIALFICAIGITVMISLIGFGVSVFYKGTLTLADFLILSLVTGLIEYIAILFLSLSIAFISFRHGLDPDNLISPLISTIADLIGISVIVIIYNWMI